MESPKEIHKRLKELNGIEDIAYTRLFVNYLELKLKEQHKLIEIESTDQESLIKKFTRTPLPGFIYTFFYVNEKNLPTIIDTKKNKEFEFHDFTPILFCTYSNPLTKTFGGLNLCMLPQTERLKFFTSYFELYQDYFKDVERDTQNSKISLNKKYISLVLSGNNQVMIKKFSQQQNAVFNYAYRKYTYDHIREIRMLEYEEWPYISFFNAKQAFKKMNMNKIHQLYWKQRKN